MRAAVKLEPMSDADRNAATLAASCAAGNMRALARLISALEAEDSRVSDAAFEAVFQFNFPRRVIGVTGPPGGGKSTLIDYLAGLLLARARADPQTEPKVAILAIDPSSPFTGGALLGGRIRKASLGHTGVFIRSMGKRRVAGG